MSSSGASRRKQTTENGRGAQSSQPGSSRTQPSNSLREANGVADRVLEPVPTVAAEHRPELERAERAAQSRAVLAEARDVVRRAEVLGDEAEGVSQHVRATRPQRGAALRGEEPLVRVDDDRVDPLDVLERPAVLGADHRGAGVRGVDVEPGAVSLAGVGDRRDRVDRRRGRRADRRDDGARVASGRAPPAGGGTPRRPAPCGSRDRAGGTPSRRTSGRARSRRRRDRPASRGGRRRAPRAWRSTRRPRAGRASPPGGRGARRASSTSPPRAPAARETCARGCRRC